MESGSFQNLPAEELQAIVKSRYRAGHFALLRAFIEPLRHKSKSLQDLFDKLDDQLQRSLGPETSIDPAMQALIDKRFRTLVTHELSKRFGDELHQLTNLEEIINRYSTLKEIQIAVQFELSRKKLK